MQSFPQVETERLLLNELQEADLPLLTQYANNENVSAYTLNLPFPYTERDALHWLGVARTGAETGNQLVFAIRLKEIGEFVGGISLALDQRHKRAELSYWLAEPFWNRSIVTEAAKALIDFSFDKLGLHKVTAHYMKGNPASGKVMEKCGMKKEGELKEHMLKNGVFHDIELYGLTRN